MVHITEMRIPLPMTVEEFKRGQRYANWKTNESNTAEGQGGQLVSGAPYISEIWGEGFFTHSLYRLGDRLPDWVTKLVPANALVIEEKTWMAYPHIRSVLTVPFFHKLKIEIISWHENDDGSSENILGLSEAELAIRKVDMVDISFDKVQKRDYQAKLDPQFFTSLKTGRGPLLSGWHSTEVPLMCAYKLVRVEANYWGVQNRLEKLMMNGVRQIILLTHRNAFGYIDEWFDLTFEEICAWELAGRQRLKAIVNQPPIIDPNTGLELEVEESENISKSAELVKSDVNDIDEEFFEASMDWTTQEDQEFGHDVFSGLFLPPMDLNFLSASDRCAMCAGRGNNSVRGDVICLTCNDLFCSKCFSEFHITPRLREHLRHYTTEHMCSDSQSQYSGDFPSTNRNGTLGDVSSSNPTISYEPLKDDRSVRTSVADSAEQAQLKMCVEEKLAQQMDLSRQEELNCSVKVIRASSTLQSKAKGKSSYRILNALPEYSLDSSQMATPYSCILGSSYLLAKKKARLLPNELSEEIVRSISLLYNKHAQHLSSSSRVSKGQTSVRNRIRSQSIASVQGSVEKLHSLKSEDLLDPYGVQGSSDNAVYHKCVEVTVSPQPEKLKDSEEFKNFRALVDLLQVVDPRHMAHEQRLAFWINVYNALMMHAYISRGIPRTHYKRIGIMRKSAYVVGGHLFNLLGIEHAILRTCSYRPVLASLLPVKKYKKHDARQAYALNRPEPLVSFALCCGSHSSPMVRVYTAANIHAELQDACRDFLSASVGRTPHFRVVIPKIVHWYARDFSRDAKSLLEWVTLQFPEEKRVFLEECIEKKKGRKTSQRMAIASYDWKFRYILEKNLDP